MKFDPSPEGRTRFLRNKFKVSLHKRAKQVFGEDGGRILRQLEEGCPHRARFNEFYGWVRNILNKCAQMETDTDRKRYIEGCIRRERRIQELLNWQENNPDPTEMCGPEELRTMDRTKLEAKLKEIADVEFEFAVLTSEHGGSWLLVERVGRERVWRMILKLMPIFDPETSEGKRRMNYIFMRAADRQIKYPERYVNKVIECEQLKTRKRSRR